MTVADWLTHTRARFDTEPAPVAVRESARQFVRGATARLAASRYCDRDRPYPTTLAGTDARFVVETPTDVKRARSLNREAPVAEFLFAGDIAGRVVWDVGGYHGHYSVLAALRGARVVTFEPDRLNQMRIGRNADVNDLDANAVVEFAGDIDLRDVALSDTDGRAAFGGESGNVLAVGQGEQAVETRRGDGLSPAPDRVKIDVEGHELAVLDGMSNRLQGVGRIAVEVHDGVGVGSVGDRLDAAGFRRIRAIETPRSQTFLGGVR